MADIEMLVERITADPEFVDRLRADPEGVLRSVGIEPTTDLIEAVNGASSSEPLGPRDQQGLPHGQIGGVMGDMESLLDRITADPGFADRLRADPEGVLRSVGIEPTADLLEAVNGATGSEELAARISKGLRQR